MRCFYHNDAEATAQCANCGKFVCSECAMEWSEDKKIYCPNCAEAINKYIGEQQQEQIQQTKLDKKAYKKFKIKWLIIYLVEIVLSFFFLAVGFGVAGAFGAKSMPLHGSIIKYFNSLGVLHKFIVLTVTGIPGALCFAITGMPRSNEEKLLREVEKTRFAVEGGSTFLYLVLAALFGNAFTIIAIPCSIIIIIQLIKFKRENIKENKETSE